jgi:hypothetical protein
MCLFIYLDGVELSPLLLRPLIGLLYQPWIIDGDYCGALIGMNDLQGRPKYSEKTRPSAALSTMNFTDWTCTRTWATAVGRPNYGTSLLLSY